MPNPGYPIYAGALAIAGVTPWYLPLKEEFGFVPDLDSIPEEIWAKATFILLNFPGIRLRSGPILLLKSWLVWRKMGRADRP